ncbi:hypothetical protein [Mycolicibacterium brisbanense]
MRPRRRSAHLLVQPVGDDDAVAYHRHLDPAGEYRAAGLNAEYIFPAIAA